MVKGKEILVEEMKDVEQGVLDGEGSSVKVPLWSKLAPRTSSIALSSILGRYSSNDLPKRPDKVTRLTGFPAEQRSHDHGARFRALPHVIRGHIVSMIGELLGTFSFLFFAFSATQIAVNSNHPPHSALAQSPSMLLYVSLAFGFSLAVNAWTFFRVSGGLFNPAVNFALCVVGALTWTRGGLLFIAQMIGALIAAAVVSVLFPGDFNVGTTLGTGANVAQGLFIEAFATFELVLVIFMLAAEKHDGRFLAPIGIGIALFVAELASVAYTGGSLNPVRSFAPAVVNHSFPNHHWIYWLGPLIGAISAAMVYKLLKILEYETANPDSIDPMQNALNESNIKGQSSHTISERRPATPPIFAVGRNLTELEEDEFQDANEQWALKPNLRNLSGFGEGLISTVPQGTSSKQNTRLAPD